MGLRFLSNEYMETATTTMNADPGFVDAAADAALQMQFVVTDVPGEGEVPYYIRLADGQGEMARGEIENPDATVRHSYQTAVKLSRGEINQQIAFMTGKLRVSGNLAKLMIHQGALGRFQEAMGPVDVDY